MIDPTVIGTAISGVVSLITSYMTYRVGMKTAENAAAKPDDKTVQQGESALEIVRTGVSQYGTEDEKADLANFERNPQRYEAAFAQMLIDIANRYPVFAQELQSFVRQNDVQPGSINISGGTIQGNVVNQNPGTINSTYNLGDRDRTT